MTVANYEKLGVFYLGRLYDIKAKRLQDELLLYDSRDLVTHGVIVGMTGSGKTGLGIGLIEEAAIDHVPVMAIDPKGDLTNLLLTFPDLKGQDLYPWVNPDEARKKGISIEEYASQQAALWSKGLADWGQSGERIRALCEAADFVIYTPGSNAGIPVSILKSFAAPGEDVLNDNDLMRERISTTATSLLGLLGIKADPMQSREHILLSTILDLAWREGRDLDLAALIQRVQTPPFTRVGVLDLESFYPAKERFGLVMALNNLVASPGFNAWLEGEALDIGNILYTPEGKPRVSIFSIAHLSDPERMFFVSLLLNQILGWMRSQPGTTSLRALVYMDEIFGYFPPLSNPPAKVPLLTLLKQARAYGVGIVLATQNPVDLDYKGLANTGTWFVGRLQTERDKARLLDGLEGVSLSTQGFDRREMEQTISSLGSRVFLMNNIHEDAPVIFQTRWVMSYLSGPLTRDQIKLLMGPQRSKAVTIARPAPRPATFAVEPEEESQRSAVSPRGERLTAQVPVVPAGMTQFFVAPRGRTRAGTRLLYEPRVLGIAKVRYVDSKSKIDEAQDLVFATPVMDEAIPVNWENAQPIEISAADLDKAPVEGGQYSELPALRATSQTTWNKEFVTWLVQNQSLSLMMSPSLKQVSKPGESERDFRIRLQQLYRERRDEQVEHLRDKYAPKVAVLQERIRRAQQVVDKQREQSAQQKTQAAISIGATVLSALTGRKISNRSTMGRATTAMRGVARSVSEQQDIGRAKETVAALQEQLEEVQSTFDAEAAALQARTDPSTEVLETVEVRPKRTNISIQLVTLVWVPVWLDSVGRTNPAWL